MTGGCLRRPPLNNGCFPITVAPTPPGFLVVARNDGKEERGMTGEESRNDGGRTGLRVCPGQRQADYLPPFKHPANDFARFSINLK